jgi:hypothetical protein
MGVEEPDALLARLKLGREEYLQRLVTMLIVDGPYPRWNTGSTPSAQGLAFLRELERLSFGEVGAWHHPIFIDEFDLPRRHDLESSSAPDWALLDSDRLWIIELKTERGSHRPAQLPAYFDLARHHHPELTLDLTYLTGPLSTQQPAVPEGCRYAHVEWADLMPVITDVWSDTHGTSVDQIRRVVAGLGEPWTAWRAERLAQPLDAEDHRDPLDEGVELARATADDHQQRALGLSAADLGALQDLRLELQERLASDDDPALGHVRPWLWRPTSGGKPMTASGAEVGYELRFSWYANPR